MCIVFSFPSLCVFLLLIGFVGVNWFNCFYCFYWFLMLIAFVVIVFSLVLIVSTSVLLRASAHRSKLILMLKSV